MPTITDGVFSGSGPFTMPLLTRFISVQAAPELAHLVAEFEFADGARILVPIDLQSALMFADAARTVPAVFAQKASKLPKS